MPPEVLFPVKDGPFYACTFDPVLGETMVTMGGIITDGEQNAVDANYEPIPGLYMAGNDWRPAVSGTEYVNPHPRLLAGLRPGARPRVRQVRGEILG